MAQLEDDRMMVQAEVLDALGTLWEHGGCEFTHILVTLTIVQMDHVL